jgi:hypothetical protein
MKQSSPSNFIFCSLTRATPFYVLSHRNRDKSRVLRVCWLRLQAEKQTTLRAAITNVSLMPHIIMGYYDQNPIDQRSSQARAARQLTAVSHIKA